MPRGGGTVSQPGLLGHRRGRPKSAKRVRSTYEEYLPPQVSRLVVRHTPDGDASSVASIVALVSRAHELQELPIRSDGLREISIVADGHRLVTNMWPESRELPKGWQERLADSLVRSIGVLGQAQPLPMPLDKRGEGLAILGKLLRHDPAGSSEGHSALGLDATSSADTESPSDELGDHR